MYSLELKRAVSFPNISLSQELPVSFRPDEVIASNVLATPFMTLTQNHRQMAPSAFENDKDLALRLVTNLFRDNPILKSPLDENPVNRIILPKFWVFGLYQTHH